MVNLIGNFLHHNTINDKREKFYGSLGFIKCMETFVAFALSKVLKKTIAQLNIRPNN